MALTCDTFSTQVTEIDFDQSKVIEVIKNDNLEKFDINSYAKLKEFSLKNGSFEAALYSQLLDDAPDFARGFIGLAFHISDDNNHFESFYIRPTNGRVDDPVRKNRAFQYFAYPDYDFAYFRDRDIKDYEGPADIGLGEWISLKVELLNETIKCYVNNQLVLETQSLLKDIEKGLGLGLFVDTGTRAYFRNIKVVENEKVN